MRYSSHPPRTFRNRSTRYLGVLVGAALVATLGLPSAVQAQTTSTPVVSYDDVTDAFMVSRPHDPIGTADNINYWWVLEVDGPVSVPDMAVVDPNEFGQALLFTVQAKGTDGDWMFRLASGLWVDEDEDEELDAAEVTMRNTGPWLSHMHGRPDAPEDFAYAMSGTNHLFTWEDAIPSSPNVGVMSYWLRWTSDDPTLQAAKWTDHGKAIEVGFYRLSPGQTRALKDGEYTFELTAEGTSSSTPNKTSAAASLMVQIGDEGPTPAPTLPEIAALFLAMLLLGSGAYLLRRRQSSGLINA